MGLFDEQLARKPDHYPWANDFIKAIHNGHWTKDEFNFKSDYGQFKNDLTDEQREVVTRTLSAIGQIEIAVKKFWANLGDNLPHPSITDLGFVMANNEVIHNQAYEHLLSFMGLEAVFEENLKNPIIAGRVNYLRKYLNKVYEDDRKQYIYSIILFTLFVENVSLFSQFYIVMHFNRFHNVLKDTSQQVEYTRNEETLHANIGIKIINTLREEYPELFDEELERRVKEECEAALIAESAVISWILGDYHEETMSNEVLTDFIAKRINDSMQAIGFEQVIDRRTKHDEKFLWMEEETIGNSHTDFFHKRPVDYAVGNNSYSVEDFF